jgi:hypothetical protein
MRVVIVTCGILVGALWFAAFTPRKSRRAVPGRDESGRERIE